MSLSASMTPSRTTGIAPLTVTFDATGTTSSTTSKPFHHLLHKYHFGDNAGGATWQWSGRSKNRARGAIGVHTFETPGAFTVTYTVKNSLGETQQITSVITVYDPANSINGFGDSKTFCFNNLGDSDFAWAPSYATTNRIQTNTWSTVITAIAGGGGNRQVLLKPGSIWTSTTTQLPATGPGLLGSYQSGVGYNVASKPSITLSGGGNCFRWGYGTSDWRLMDLNVDAAVGTGNDGLAGGNDLNNNNQQNRTLALRYTVGSGFNTGFGASYFGIAGGGHYNSYSENYIIDCDCTGVVSYGMYWGGEKSSIMGMKCTHLSGTTGSSAASRLHCVRPWLMYKGVIQHCNLLNDGLNEPPNYLAIKLFLTYEVKDANMPDTQYVVISDNDCIGAYLCIGVGPEGPEPEKSVEVCKDVIIERNYLHDLNGTTNDMRAFASLEGPNITFRFNKLNANGIYAFFNPGILVTSNGGAFPVPDGVEVYNNTQYKGNNTTEDIMIRLTSVVTNAVVRNNLNVVTSSFTGDSTVVSDSGIGTIKDHNFSRVQQTFNDLANPGGSPPDFHLNSGSGMRNGGAATPWQSMEDYDLGVVTDTPDVGAFEYGSSPDISDGGSPATVAFGMCA